MYIPEFWCGVGACILGEVAIILVAAIICALKPSSDDKEDEE